MPWRIKRRFYLTLLGVGALVLAIVVWVRNAEPDTDLLAGGLFLGGIAMLIIALPENGKDNDS
jgi:formate-dependent nitrite reductase membrane component NrfD